MKNLKLHLKDWQSWLPFALLALVALIFIFTWLGLGAFRFMMPKFMSFNGFPFGTREYLVLIQDESQLMPTGGKITHLGTLTYKHGFNKGITLQAAEDIPNLEEQPLLVMRTLIDEKYELDQANYDPNLGASEEAIMQFLSQDFDATISVTHGFLESLMEQEIPSDLAEFEELINELKFTKDTELLEQAFNQKQVQAFFHRSRLAKPFADRSWNGLTPQTNTGDFLYISEANFSATSTSPSILRDVQYEIDVLEETDILGNPKIQATLQVTLSHEGSTGEHEAYLRSMIPLGSDVETSYDVEEDRQDMDVIGELLRLQPGDSITYTYTYDLPEYVWVNGTYYLSLLKQPGTLGDFVRVIVRAPSGMSLSSDEFAVTENLGIYETRLLTDEQISFSLLEDDTAPQLVEATFLNANQIQIRFNERMGESAEDPSRYQMAGITVLEATVENELVTLDIEGLVGEEQERELSIRDIRDKNGILLDPNPVSLSLISPEVEASEEELAPEEEEGNNEAEITPEETPTNE